MATLVYNMTVTIRYKKGDTIPLTYAVEEWNIDTQGVEPYDLTNTTVTFSMRGMNAETWDIADQPCSVVSATEGLVEYAWATGETDTAGMYRTAFKVTNAEGKVSSFPEYGVQWLWIVDDATV